MFNATPPAGARARRVPGRKQPLATDPANGQLAYISPQPNFAYGSRVANLPKAPRLSETKVRLADAIQEKQDEAEKRIEEERQAREAAQRDRLSMPPPSVPSVSQSPARSRAQSMVRDFREESTPMPMPMDEPTGRGKDVVVKRSGSVSDGSAEFDELSALSGFVDNNNSFRGAYRFDQPVSTKVTETVVEPSEQEDGEDDHFDYEPPAPPEKKSSRTRRAASPEKSVPLQPSSKTNGIARKTRSSARGKKSAEKGTEKETYTQQPEEDEANKENRSRDEPRSTARETASTKVRSRAVRKSPQVDQLPQEKEKSYSLEDSYIVEAPKFSESPLDWLFYQYNEIVAGRVIWYLVILLLLLGLLYRSFSPEVDHFLSRQHWPMPWTQNGDVYKPPAAPPQDIFELADRIHKFEKALGKVDMKFGNKFDKEVKTLNGALDKISLDLSSIKNYKTQSEADKIATGQVITDLKKRLETAEQRAKEYKAIVNPAQFKELIRRVEDLTPENLHHIIRRELRTALPNQMVAHIDSNDGSIRFMPEFEKVLQDLIQNYLPTALSKNSVKLIGSQPAVPEQSWEKFLKANRARMMSTIDDRVSEGLKEAATREAVISKDIVMNMIQDRLNAFTDKYEEDYTKEFAKYSSSTERKQAAAFAQMEAQLAALEAKYKKLAVTPSPRASAPTTGAGISTTYGVNLPDFANYKSGAYPYPYLTSPSYDPASSKSSWFNAGRQNVAAKHPATALTTSTDIGDCWAFPTDQGILGISLAKRIYPSHIAIEHGFKHHLIDETSTPKHFSFWVLTKDEDERMKLEREVLHAAGRVARDVDPKDGNIIGDDEEKAQKWARFVKVGEWSYDIDGERMQTWDLPVDFQALGIAVRRVAFRFEGNYGNQEFTCIYRTKVHGYQADKGEETKEAPGISEQKEKKKGWF